MWQASPTFKGQWRRLAAGTGVRLSVLVEDLPRPSESFKARTLLKYQDGLLVSAQVYPAVVDALVHRATGAHLESSSMAWTSAQSGNGVSGRRTMALETRRA
jgi:hypothetical protein